MADEVDILKFSVLKFVQDTNYVELVPVLSKYARDLIAYTYCIVFIIS